MDMNEDDFAVDERFARYADNGTVTALDKAHCAYLRLVGDVCCIVQRLTDYRETLLGYLDDYEADPASCAASEADDASEWGSEVSGFAMDIREEIAMIRRMLHTPASLEG